MLIKVVYNNMMEDLTSYKYSKVQISDFLPLSLNVG